MDWLKAVDWQLLCTVGDGFRKFAPVEGDTTPIQRRPHLALILDKGSDDFCATWFLLFQEKLRVSPTFDPLHSPWRELDLAMNECRLKSSMLLSIVAHNLEYGPYDGAAFFEKMKETSRELVQLINRDDRFFRDLWPRIAAEQGLDEFSVDDMDSFLSGLPEAEWLRAKGPRVCTSHWGTWCEAHLWRRQFSRFRKNSRSADCFVFLPRGSW